MIQALREQQIQSGGQTETIDGQEIIASYGQEQEAIDAALNQVAICDRSHWGRIELSDSDRQSFLHNQSSNQIKTLQAGQGCETVILTSTARTIDLVTAYCKEKSLLLLVSPNQDEKLMQWFDRYIFFQDKVKLTNITTSTGCVSVMGPKGTDLLSQLGWELPEESHSHTQVEFEGESLTIAKGSGLTTEGYTLIFGEAIAASLWSKLTSLGAVPLGETGWEELRIQQGRPKATIELTDDYNPLEAGLWHLIAFDKGCYIGQETIARLDTYDGVKQKLWGLESSSTLQAGDVITVDEKKVGVVTSVLADGKTGLGYVKTKAGGEGDQVTIGEAIATIIEVPFLTRQKL